MENQSKVQQRAQRTRTAKPLERLKKRLLAYAAAAGAVGMGAVAPPCAQADIIYTPADIHIAPRSHYFLDLNHDGIDDFKLINRATSGFAYPYMRAKGLQHNGVLGSGYFAARLSQGATIGPGSSFTRRGLMGSGLGGGPWIGSFTGYLGLEFEVDGLPYYGWAEISVGFGQRGYREGLLGYAYDTIPGQAIRAGQRSATLEPGTATPEPGTLGLLALGSLGLAFWRPRIRKDRQE